MCTNGHSLLIKMAAMLLYGKKLKTLLFQNQKSFEVESLYISTGHQRCIKSVQMMMLF